MEPLRFTPLDDGIVRFTLQSGRGNPITAALLHSMRVRLDDLAKDPPRALVLDADGGRIFSGGLALPQIIDWDRGQIRDLLLGMSGVIYQILALPCPTVAALSGHAIAAGFILSLACDSRIVGESGLKFGLSEVDLGVAVPPGPIELLSTRTSPRHALMLSLHGKLFGPEEALELGFADERSVEPEARALSVARALAGKPGLGVAVTRSFFNAGLIERMKKADEAHFEAFLDTWFSAPAQQQLRAMVERLTQNR